MEGETAALVAPTVVTINPQHSTHIWTGWVGPASILAHSTDGGRRWRIVAGLPQSRDIMAIAVQPGTGFVYVTMATWQDRAMLYVSRDRVHFQRVAVPGATIGDSLLFSHTGRYLITVDARTPLASLYVPNMRWLSQVFKRQVWPGPPRRQWSVPAYRRQNVASARPVGQRMRGGPDLDAGCGHRRG